MYYNTHREGGLFRLWMGRRTRLYVEFSSMSRSFGIGVDVDSSDDDDCLFRLSLYFFSLYIGFGGSCFHWAATKLLRGSYEGRSIGFSIHDWAIWLEFWAPSMSWSRSEPWWMRWTWHPIDTFFGRTKHSEREVSRTETVIPMPEKAYPCVVVMKAETWKRPRLPWASHKITRAHIDCKEGVPYPGKGENSWDCGDDASYGLTCPAKTVEEGIAKFVESVLRSRRRHGGSVNWQQNTAA